VALERIGSSVAAKQGFLPFHDLLPGAWRLLLRLPAGLGILKEDVPIADILP
jgi:hypothetical protein